MESVSDECIKEEAEDTQVLALVLSEALSSMDGALHRFRRKDAKS